MELLNPGITSLKEDREEDLISIFAAASVG
jgi:hypothetical protein